MHSTPALRHRLHRCSESQRTFRRRHESHAERCSCIVLTLKRPDSRSSSPGSATTLLQWKRPSSQSELYDPASVQEGSRNSGPRCWLAIRGNSAARDPPGAACGCGMMLRPRPRPRPRHLPLHGVGDRGLVQGGVCTSQLGGHSGQGEDATDARVGIVEVEVEVEVSSRTRPLTVKVGARPRCGADLDATSPCDLHTSTSPLANLFIWQNRCGRCL